MFKIYFCAAFFLFISPRIFSQWIQTNGPTGGEAHCFALDSNGTGGINVFAGAGNGVYLSTDNGLKWTHCSAGLPENYISALTISGKNIFAGTNGNYAVYRSTNDGKSWIRTSSGLPEYSSANAFAVCDTNVFVALYDGLYVSNNNGISWTKIGSGLPEYGNALELAVSGKNILAMFSDKGIYRSTDCGKSWSAVGSVLPGYANVFKLVSDGTNIFAGVYDRGVYRSTDNGSSWSPVNSGLPKDSLGNLHIKALALYGKNIYALFAGGFFLSSDNGANWEKISLGLQTTSYAIDLAITGTTMFAATLTGIFRSTDNGVNWTDANSGFINSNVTALAVNDTNIFAGSRYYGWDGGIFLSTDKGASWTLDSLRHPGTAVYNYLMVNDFAVSGTNTYAGGLYWGPDAYYNYTALLVYNGKDWTDISSGLYEYSSVEALAVNDGILFAAVPGRSEWETSEVGVSTDNGKSWLRPGLVLPQIKDLIIFGNSIFAATKKGVYRSTDTCKSWTKVSSGLPKGSGEEIYALTVCDSYLFVSPGGSEVYISTDNGANWFPNRAYIGGIYSFAVKGSYIFASSSNGVFMSDDYFRTAIELSAGFPKNAERFQINALALSKTDLFAATNAGVWRRPLADMIILAKSRSADMPAQYRLEQNYPNPFNPKTTINYTIANRSYVKLIIYDILGREVTALVRKEQDAGNYQVQFDGTSLPSGIYIYAIQAGQFRDSKKLVHLK